jgi:hypothetical protein
VITDHSLPFWYRLILPSLIFTCQTMPYFTPFSFKFFEYLHITGMISKQLATSLGPFFLRICLVLNILSHPRFIDDYVQ